MSCLVAKVWCPTSHPGTSLELHETELIFFANFSAQPSGKLTPSVVLTALALSTFPDIFTHLNQPYVFTLIDRFLNLTPNDQFAILTYSYKIRTFNIFDWLVNLTHLEKIIYFTYFDLFGPVCNFSLFGTVHEFH